MDRKIGGAVLVTGASSGIGRETALHLAEVGYKVFACVRFDRDLEELNRLAQQQKNYKGVLLPIKLDVTNNAQIEEAFANVKSQVGADGLLGLINNAGISGSFLPFELTPIEDYEKIINVNLLAQIRMTKTFFPLLKVANGTVVFINSPSSYLPLPLFSGYGASKSGLDLFSRSLTRELRSVGVHAVSLIVGSVKSKMTANAAQSGSEMKKKHADWPAAYQQLAVEFGNWMNKVLGEEAYDTSCVSDKIELILRDKTPSSVYYVGNYPPRFLNTITDSILEWVFSQILKLL